MLVVNPAYDTVTEAWFDPDYWGEGARLVSTGGRGSAWFVDTDYGELVLRHYRRGGLMARFSERSYLFTGSSATRSWREFQLLRLLYDLGLPVPEPVAAWWRKQGGLSYRAAILIRRIDGAVPLPEVSDLANDRLWRQVGTMIHRFHTAGLDHVDLNCDNILVAGNQTYLIDFDRCELRSPRRNPSAWQKRNLDRLSRSMEKRIPARIQERCRSMLLAGYQQA